MTVLRCIALWLVMLHMISADVDNSHLGVAANCESADKAVLLQGITTVADTQPHEAEIQAPKKRDFAQVSLTHVRSGWPTAWAEFEEVSAKGWCVDSEGSEGVSRSYASGDACQQNCNNDDTCPAYATGAPWDGGAGCVWYTDKSPQASGNLASKFFVTSASGNKGKWRAATCFRKKFEGAPESQDNEEVLSPPFLGAQPVTQAPLDCKPSHCAGNGNGYATDWEMPKRTAIVAARGGVVVSVVDVHGDGGSCYNAAGEPITNFDPNFVTVQHSDGTMGVYMHLDAGTAKVQPGQWVTRGMQLAGSGNSGCTTAPHLHFHVRSKDSLLTVPVSFNWPCQQKFGVPPKRGEYYCNTDGCDCTPTCWKEWPASMPGWMKKPWTEYCASSWTGILWIMGKGCHGLMVGSDEAKLTKGCSDAGEECGTFDKDRARCS